MTTRRNRSALSLARTRFVALCALIALGFATLPTSPLRADQNERPGDAFQAAISAGGNHTCALLTTGRVRCWGNNSSGQLGIAADNLNNVGDNETPTADVNLGGATVTAITAGDGHSCALLAGGNVRCWGSGSFGQLGLGNTESVYRDPTANVSFGASASQVTAGASHTCALLTGGAIRCWGSAVFGQLGLGNQIDIGDDETPTANVNLGGATATAISAGTLHTCALLTSGDVRCWGFNNTGQLGLANTETIDAIGDNEKPTLNVNLGGATVTAITAGRNHTCALLGGGSVRCWGSGAGGQLGLGNTDTIGDNENPTTNVNLGGASAVAISAGDGHTCAVLSNAAIRCWGANSSGQLGLGNTDTIGDNENPTTNVKLDDAQVGPDLIAPRVSVQVPFPYSQLTPPVTITGTASDDRAIAKVQVAIVRSLGSLQYWDGAGWQNEYTTVDATVLDPSTANTTWTYVFNGPGGYFAVTPVAFDTSGNTGTTTSTFFTIADSVAPTVTATSPTPDQTLTTKPITISGTAADNSVITAVDLILYRPLGNGGQYWNGSAWDYQYTTVPTVLSTPRTKSTGWTYNFNPPQTGGNFYFTAVARDASYNFKFTPYARFVMPDDTAPTATLLPPHNTTSSGTQFITGTAVDNNSIYAVYLAIYRVSDATYWNGSGWVSGFATVPTTSTPGANYADFAYSFNPPTPGYYLTAALPIDTNYNYRFIGWNTINVTSTR
jgi:alpha-tubulin suppressor-like RCC1 family protein